MQIGHLFVGSLGIVMLAVFCVCLALRKPSDIADLGDLERLAREEQKKHGFVWRR